ncbi:protein-methionine-sulfoxide reductase heme-binding subunit MsrQ [Sphingomonas glaciei]|uniref:Ferric reductase-like transmembrane domain-containing protein n=1 Tax=Sphingomonas glaciei TaxID=2938948 RepID=A0ABY5MQY9_9SPHN|nr:ferric reductase-like transmembrane domain-containing protein [Sphingomonas glaciei]UUR06807.1 ferric reductase-like transmembrane domain-containing protein [Sphingomonas glaciei]
MTSCRSTLFWLILALPLALALVRFALTPDAYPGDLLHPTGEWSARFIILALMVTPLRQLWPQARIVRFLARHRRALGVAGFLYALAHTAAYVLDMVTLAEMLAEVGAPSIWTGWAALAILVPLGLTSNDAAMRALRGGWKRLQRLAYPAAILTLVHWALVHDGLAAALLHFVPLALLQAVRLVRLFSSPTPRSLA